MADEYTAALRLLRARLEEVQAEEHRLRVAIQALEALAKGNGAKPPAGTWVRKRVRVAAPTGPGRKSKTLQLAETILREKGSALHIKELQTEMAKRGVANALTKQFRDSLARSLDRKADMGQVFNKPAPATYGLREWKGGTLPLED